MGSAARFPEWASPEQLSPMISSTVVPALPSQCLPTSALDIHHIVVNDWEVGVDAPQNVVLLSLPSVLDPSLAPAGAACLHAYTPGTEPAHLWEGLRPGSLQYEQLKEERSQVGLCLLRAGC